jgi:hypothetical protein
VYIPPTSSNYNKLKYAEYLDMIIDAMFEIQLQNGCKYVRKVVVGDFNAHVG